MIALFDGGMMDAAWPVAQTPASSNPANPIAIADFGIAQCPPLAFGSVPASPQHHDAAGRSVQVARAVMLPEGAKAPAPVPVGDGERVGAERAANLAGVQVGRVDASLFDLIVRLNLAVPYLFWRKTSLLTSKMLPVVGNNSPCSERPGTGSLPSPRRAQPLETGRLVATGELWNEDKSFWFQSPVFFLFSGRLFRDILNSRIGSWSSNREDLRCGYRFVGVFLGSRRTGPGKPMSRSGGFFRADCDRDHSGVLAIAIATGCGKRYPRIYSVQFRFAALSGATA